MWKLFKIILLKTLEAKAENSFQRQKNKGLVKRAMEYVEKLEILTAAASRKGDRSIFPILAVRFLF